MDHPLYWRSTRAQARYPISGTEVVEDVAASTNYAITVDHEVDAIYAQADPPVVEDVADVNCVLCADGTNGQQFRLLVMVGAGFTGADYGYGTGSPDIVIHWTREGVLSGPA